MFNLKKCANQRRQRIAELHELIARAEALRFDFCNLDRDIHRVAYDIAELRGRFRAIEELMK